MKVLIRSCSGAMPGVTVHLISVPHEIVMRAISD